MYFFISVLFVFQLPNTFELFLKIRDTEPQYWAATQNKMKSDLSMTHALNITIEYIVLYLLLGQVKPFAAIRIRASRQRIWNAMTILVMLCAHSKRFYLCLHFLKSCVFFVQKVRWQMDCQLCTKQRKTLYRPKVSTVLCLISWIWLEPNTSESQNASKTQCRKREDNETHVKTTKRENKAMVFTHRKIKRQRERRRRAKVKEKVEMQINNRNRVSV